MIFSGEERQAHVVSAILLDADGRILLQQRDEKPDLLYAGWWTIFGGWAETGETPLEAIRRELREELDLEVTLTHWRTYDCPVRSKPGEVHTHNHVFAGTLDRPVESLTLHEGQGMKLFTPDDAVRLELAFAQHVMLRDYLHDVRGFDIGANLLVLEPHDIEAGRKYPLVIFLHGSGERGDELERVFAWGLPKFMTAGGDLPEPAYVLIPQCPTDTRWGYMIERLERLLDHTLASYPIDTDRVYLTGFSMGGFGSWQWANEAPHRFAAMLPVGGSAFKSNSGRYFLDLKRITDQVAVWIVNSAADSVVPVTGADELTAALKDMHADFRYTRYTDVDHVETADKAFRDSTYYEWLFKQRRKRAST